jgi:septum formation protein
MVRENVHLILASSSPRRQELIQMLGLPIRIVPSHVEETIDEQIPPDQIVETLSLRKAVAAAELCQEPTDREGIIVASDTIVVLDGTVYGKPANPQDAVRMLGELQGRTHQVYTGLACMDLGTTHSNQRNSINTTGILKGHTVSHVSFRSMTDEEIGAYVKTRIPLDKAGAYGVQGIGSVFIEKIEGDFYSIMGLPMNLLYQMLLKFGVSPFHQSLFH